MKTATLSIVIALAVSACVPKPVDTFCLNYKPVHYSASQDSEETKRQIKENNAVWKELCQ